MSSDSSLFRESGSHTDLNPETAKAIIYDSSSYGFNEVMAACIYVLGHQEQFSSEDIHQARVAT